MVTEVIKYDLTEMEITLKAYVDQSINFAKVEQKLGKKSRISNPYVLKDPTMYELKNSYSNIHDDQV